MPLRPSLAPSCVMTAYVPSSDTFTSFTVTASTITSDTSVGSDGDDTSQTLSVFPGWVQAPDVRRPQVPV